jgi:PAS domain S-box-containing protein
MTWESGGRASEKANEERLKIAVRAARIGIWDWDIARDRIDWSDQVYEIHGLDRAEFGGTLADYRALVHPDDLSRVFSGIQSAIATRENYNAEFRILRPCGDVRWISVSAELISDESGNPARLVGATVDITERKRTEEALLRANDELQQFAYAASHDLQEPLRTVTTFTQLLVRELEDQLKGDAQQYVGFILDGTRRMRALIDGLLALSRSTAATGNRLQLVETGKIVADCLVALRIAVEESGAAIVFDRLPDVMGDGNQLTQLFQNLVSNSIKYRKVGQSPRIEISAIRRNHAEWLFCVRDDGQGFDPEMAQVIFRPFRRLHGRDVPGAGIGLALCRRIVERHGGQICADAMPGAGAAFFFTLPAAPVKPEE